MAEIKLNKRYKYAGDIFQKLISIGFDVETATTFLNEVEDANVVEVVRCKDCEFRGTDNCPNSYYLECEGAYVDPMEDDDFCSYGTPKEMGGEK